MIDRQRFFDALLLFMLFYAAVLMVSTMLTAHMADLARYITALSVFATLTRLMKLRPKKLTLQPLRLSGLAGWTLAALWALWADDFLAYAAWGLISIFYVKFWYESDPSMTGNASPAHAP